MGRKKIKKQKVFNNKKEERQPANFSMLVHSHEKFTLNSFSVTEEGYLEANDSTIYRAGIFEFYLSEFRLENLPEELRTMSGSTVLRGLVELESIQDKQYLESLSQRPITDEHPATMADARNTRYVQRGVAKTKGRVKGDLVKCPLLFTDSELIEKIKNGKKGLSQGNYATFTWGKGTHPVYGHYDFKMTELRANHIAVTNYPRGGEQTVINERDGQQSLNTKTKEIEKMEETIVVNGVEITFSKQAAQAYRQVEAERDKLKSDTSQQAKQIATLNSEKSAVEAERDKLAHDANDQGVFNSRVAERVELVNRAKTLHPEVDEKLNDIDLKRTAVQHSNPGMSLDGKDDAYIEALFDFCCKEKSDGSDGLGAAVRNSESQRPQGSGNLSDKPVFNAQQKAAKALEEQQKEFRSGKKSL